MRWSDSSSRRSSVWSILNVVASRITSPGRIVNSLSRGIRSRSSRFDVGTRPGSMLIDRIAMFFPTKTDGRTYLWQDGRRTESAVLMLAASLTIVSCQICLIGLTAFLLGLNRRLGDGTLYRVRRMELRCADAGNSEKTEEWSFP